MSVKNEMEKEGIASFIFLPEWVAAAQDIWERKNEVVEGLRG